jgi:pSer/pThr/pTyr-binding forkhead associated (FHA) protein
MHAKLFCTSGQLAGKVFHIGDEAIIGSSPDSTIYIRHGIISSRHVHLTYDRRKNCYFLEDLKSYNGTKLDGKDLHGKRRLGDRHVITLANTFEFTFETAEDDGRSLPFVEEHGAPVEEPPQAAEGSADEKMARTIVLDYNEMFQQVAPAAPSFFIEFKTVRGGKQSIRLKEGQNTVGRSTSSDITIENPSISRQHAVLKLQGEALTVEDMGSRNGTFVNERRIANETEIPPDTELRFGLVNAVIVKKSEQGKH